MNPLNNWALLLSSRQQFFWKNQPRICWPIHFFIRMRSQKREKSNRAVRTLFVQRILTFQAKRRAACLVARLGRYSTSTAVKRLLVHPVCDNCRSETSMDFYPLRLTRLNDEGNDYDGLKSKCIEAQKRFRERVWDFLYILYLSSLAIWPEFLSCC